MSSRMHVNPHHYPYFQPDLDPAMVSAEAAEAMASIEEVEETSSNVVSYEDVEFTADDAKITPPSHSSTSPQPSFFPTDSVSTTSFSTRIIRVW